MADGLLHLPEEVVKHLTDDTLDLIDEPLSFNLGPREVYDLDDLIEAVLRKRKN